MESIGEFFVNIADFLGNTFFKTNSINNAIGRILTIMLAYKSIYVLIGIFFTRKFKKAKKNHKYGIVIAARNEKNVIGNLLESINKQDYPKKLLKVFVVADNCTDNTAEIARKHGAICYERFNDTEKTKGYALQFLFKNIEKDYGTQNFEGFFVFDADNLLKKDYISKMNDAFDSGEKIITSYRNTKNFGENWISATYALHWIRSIRFNHRARSVFRLATNIQGTGFLFASEIVKNGWKYTSLTEDRALTADAVAQGYRISYCNDAMFYDEQPTTVKIMLRQRLRWARGHILAFLESGPKLFINIFFGKLFVKERWSKEDKKKYKNMNPIKRFCLKFVESIRHRFASYDTLLQLTPLVVFNIARWLVVSFIIYACYCYGAGIHTQLFTNSNFVSKLFNDAFGIMVNIGPGVGALLLGLLISLIRKIFYRLSMIYENMLAAIYVFVVENKNIVPIPLYKKIIFCIMWPSFDIVGRYSTYVACFKNVEWKPIPHDSKVTIDDIHK